MEQTVYCYQFSTNGNVLFLAELLAINNATKLHASHLAWPSAQYSLELDRQKEGNHASSHWSTLTDQKWVIRSRIWPFLIILHSKIYLCYMTSNSWADQRPAELTSAVTGVAAGACLAGVEVTEADLQTTGASAAAFATAGDDCWLHVLLDLQSHQVSVKPTSL